MNCDIFTNFIIPLPFTNDAKTFCFSSFLFLLFSFIVSFFITTINRITLHTVKARKSEKWYFVLCTQRNETGEYGNDGFVFHYNNIDGLVKKVVEALSVCVVTTLRSSIR